MMLLLVLLLVLVSLSCSFQYNHMRNNLNVKINNKKRYNSNINMIVDHIDHSWIQLAAQGIAEASSSPFDKDILCPGFGEPGWGPFCWLNGNPVFKAFDSFQGLVQSSVIALHDKLAEAGIQHAYGPSIILFTLVVRLVIFPLTFRQLSSSQVTQSLAPKIQEIKEKYPDNKELQNQMVAMLYQETQVNPLAGCLPALAQIPVFIALYRSFLNLAQESKLDESFLWLPSLDGPVYGERSSDWLFAGWHDYAPSLGWHDTIAFLTIPAILIIAQTISLRVLTPPSDDPTIQQSQRILKYLPLLLGYFSLSVPAGLGVYWITNNVMSTVTTLGIKTYLKSNPQAAPEIDIEKLANSQNSALYNPAWGYSTREQMFDEAKINMKPTLTKRIPESFV